MVSRLILSSLTCINLHAPHDKYAALLDVKVALLDVKVDTVNKTYNKSFLQKICLYYRLQII